MAEELQKDLEIVVMLVGKDEFRGQLLLKPFPFVLFDPGSENIAAFHLPPFHQKHLGHHPSGLVGENQTNPSPVGFRG